MFCYSNIYPTRCNVTQFILFGNYSTCFGWYHHPSSGEQTTVSTASGICYTIAAICRYHGRVGTGLSMLWVVHISHSTLKPVAWPNHDQQHCYHHAPTVKPEAATAVVELLMMGVRTPKTC
jgi:hypothetical protein